MQKVPFKFDMVPEYFHSNFWYTNNQAGYKNRIFVQWVCWKTKQYPRVEEHHGENIHLEAGEFYYSHPTCTLETGLSNKESRVRITRAIDEGIIKILTEKCGRYHSVFRWDYEALCKISEKKGQPDLREENDTKRAALKQKGQPKGQPEGQPDLRDKFNLKGQPEGQPKRQESTKSTESTDSFGNIDIKSNNTRGIESDESLLFLQIDDSALRFYKKLNAEQKHSFLWMKRHNFDTCDKTLTFWARKYSLTHIKDLYAHAIVKKPDSIGAYIGGLIRDNVKVPDDNFRANKEFAINFRDQNHWVGVEIQEEYIKCTTGRGHNMEVYFGKPAKQFVDDLYEMFERSEGQDII